MKRPIAFPKILFLLLPFFLGSCYRNLYLPSMAYAPQLQEKGEVELGVNGNGSAGLQVQSAWAATNYFGLQAQANAVSKNGADVLGGLNFRLQKKLDSTTAFLLQFSAGYSGGTYSKYIARETGTGTTGYTAQPGYFLYDLYARWHGGYFQVSYGVRGRNKLSLFGGLRCQWLNCEDFRYTAQFFAFDSASHFIPGQLSQINSRHGFTTIVENFIGLHYGWKHFHFFGEVQFRTQYNGSNLNDTWVTFKGTTATAGVLFLFGGKK